MMNGGIIIGALISALFSGDFRLRRPRQWQGLLRIFGGGILMGYAAGLASGCNIGAFFSAVPSLGLNGWVFGSTMVVGSFIGVKLLQRWG